MNERLIIQKVYEGDRRAMQQLYSLTVHYLTAVCQRYMGNDDDVKDVLQESYIKIFKNIGGFEIREGASLKSWMTRIVVNESLMALRKVQNNIFVDVADGLPDIVDDLEVDRYSSSELQTAIMALPTGYRTVLNLYVFEEKSHKEIAQTLGIKESSSASQLNRAKKMLKGLLNKTNISA